MQCQSKSDGPTTSSCRLTGQSLLSKISIDADFAQCTRVAEDQIEDVACLAMKEVEWLFGLIMGNHILPLHDI